MGAVISYDDDFAAPSSEIKLDSGEHVVLRLDKKGLVIKALANAGRPERIIFQGRAGAVAQICASLFDDQGRSKSTPLQILVAAVTQLPNAAAVENAFAAATATL